MSEVSNKKEKVIYGNCLLYALYCYFKSGTKGVIVVRKTKSRAGITFYYKNEGKVKYLTSNPKGNGSPYFYKGKIIIRQLKTSHVK